MEKSRRVDWGKLPDGRVVEAVVLENGGYRATFLSLGVILHAWEWPMAGGSWLDVVQAAADAGECLADTSYHGAVLGRYGNRIAAGKFALDGKTYQLDVNNGPNHLHGGLQGFDRALWSVELLDGAAARFSLVSPDGDQGYPGKLEVTVTCALLHDGTVSYAYKARTDAPTVLNLTAHPYFNLAGHAAGSYEADHLLQIFAENYVPLDGTGIPLGPILPVAGTAYDFRAPRPPREPDGHAELAGLCGYDHTWVVDGEPGVLRPAARAVHIPSGRSLETWTTEPGVHFYNGFYNDRSPARMKGTGAPAASRSGFALETQHFPDSPNQPQFPSTVLRPGEVFLSRSEYRPSPGFAPDFQ